MRYYVCHCNKIAILIQVVYLNLFSEEIQPNHKTYQRLGANLKVYEVLKKIKPNPDWKLSQRKNTKLCEHRHFFKFWFLQNLPTSVYICRISTKES